MTEKDKQININMLKLVRAKMRQENLTLEDIIKCMRLQSAVLVAMCSDIPVNGESAEVAFKTASTEERHKIADAIKKLSERRAKEQLNQAAESEKEDSANEN